MDKSGKGNLWGNSSMTISVSAVGAAAPPPAPPQRFGEHRPRRPSTDSSTPTTAPFYPAPTAYPVDGQSSDHTRHFWTDHETQQPLAREAERDRNVHRRGVNQNCLLAAAFSVALLRYRQHAHLDNPRSHLNHSSEPQQAPLPVRPLLRPCLRRPARPAPQVRLHSNQVDPPLPPVSQHPPALQA